MNLLTSGGARSGNRRTSFALARAVADAPSQRSRMVDGAVGLAVFLGATTMLFAALLFAYLVLRLQMNAVPGAAPSPAFPRGLAIVNGLPLLLAEVALPRVPRARRPAALRGLALVFGFCFAAAQVALMMAFRHDLTAGGSPGRLARDTFLAISTLHLLHLAGGLVAVAVAPARRWPLVVTYWHFLFAVWGAMVFVLCVL